MGVQKLDRVGRVGKELEMKEKSHLGCGGLGLEGVRVDLLGLNSCYFVRVK